MMNVDEFVNVVKSVNSGTGNTGIRTKVLTFVDGSTLDVATDGVYTYPLTATTGIAEYVGCYVLHAVGYYNLERIIQDKQIS